MSLPKILNPGDRVFVLEKMEIDEDTKIFKMNIRSSGTFEGYEDHDGVLLGPAEAQQGFLLSGEYPAPIVNLDNEAGRVTAPVDMIFTDEEVSLMSTQAFAKEGYGFLVEFSEEATLTGDTWAEHTKLFTTWDLHTPTAEA